MKIGIDITMLVYTGSGVANYTYNLVKNLLEIDKRNEYRLFYSSFRRPKNFYYLNEFRKLRAKVYEYPFPPSLLKLIWGKLNIIPIEWFTGKVDVFFFSDFLRPPLLPGTKGVTTIHDLTWKLFPEYHTENVISAHEKKLEKTIRYEDVIIVDSENTKNDLLRLYPQINKNKVNVIYPGVGENFKPIKDKKKIEQVLKKYLTFDFSLLTSNFFLYVGAIEPRKNLELSIKVFHKLINIEIATSPSAPRDDKKMSLRSRLSGRSNPYKDWQFIVAGRAGWKNEDVFQLVKDLNLENKIKFIGYVEDEDLPYLYSACQLSFYLSSYEGFGLPPLEALACGTKVIVGDNSSLKEIIDDKYRVDLKNEDVIVKKIIEILNDKTIISDKKFTWKTSAEKFLKILEAV